MLGFDRSSSDSDAGGDECLMRAEVEDDGHAATVGAQHQPVGAASDVPQLRVLDLGDVVRARHGIQARVVVGLEHVDGQRSAHSGHVMAGMRPRQVRGTTSSAMMSLDSVVSNAVLLKRGP